MSRISKTVANAIAAELVKPKRVELKSIRDQKSELVRGYYVDQLPEGLISAFKKFNSFFNTTTSIRLNGPGLSQGYKHYSIGDELPYLNKSIALTQDQAQKVIDLDNLEQDKEKSINDLEISISVALQNLRTYNNIEKEFPEAAKLLPIKQEAAIAINIKDIRCKLDKSTC